MAITTQDGLVAAIAGAIPYSYDRSSLSNTVAGQLFSLWRATGSPLQAAIPGAATSCDNALLGCVPFNSPVSPALTYLAQLTLQGVNAGTVIVYDRLAHMGGLNGTLTTAQTANVAVPANRGVRTDYADCEWFLEWYTDTGSTAVTATVAYTNQSDAAKTTTVSLAATTRAGRMMLIVPLAGDEIKTVTTVTLSASTLTAGSFGVTVCRRIAEIPQSLAAVMTSMDAMNLGLPRVYDGSCLMLAMLCSTTTTGLIQGRIRLAQG